MAGAYKNAFGKRLGHSAAIAWAMERNNTTRVGDIPGGLGLDILRDFIKLNGGRLIVASEAGYWCQRGEFVEMTDLAFPYPGTSIVMEIDCSDQNRYELSKPTDPNDIW